ncbi:hypothetical protein GOODEAATRI_020316 [Goodea atripinnis]|uniref:Uncharacterized protein n=1 Tax=Goodea atripinnis TaxID=208336 RepID=A0ABV0NC69_9TELE
MCANVQVCCDCCSLTHKDAHFSLVPVKADGEKWSQCSHISQHNSSLSQAARLKLEPHNTITLVAYCLYNDVTSSKTKTHKDYYFQVIFCYVPGGFCTFF